MKARVKTLKRLTISVVALLLLVPCASTLAADVPRLLHVQGVLRDDSGVLSSDLFNMTFTLYNAETEGGELFTETLTNIPVDGGVFSAVLGTTADLTPSVFVDNTDIWLAVAVEGGLDLEPRIRVTTQAFAYQAQHANSADTTTNADQLGGFAAAAYQRVLQSDCGPDASIASISVEGVVTCEDDDVAEYSTEGVIEIAGNAIRLIACAHGEVVKYDEEKGWACSPDEDHLYRSGDGLHLDEDEFSAAFAGETGDFGAAITVARSDHDHTHNHDDLYFTETELQATGTINTADNPVDWTQLNNVPAEIADGLDANTEYTQGDGISFNGTEIRADLTAAGGDNGASTVVARGDHHHDTHNDTRYEPTLPSGAVMFFNRVEGCPAGWTELEAAQGRYIVGLVSEGTLAGTQGTALTDLENRSDVAPHTHSVSQSNHNHSSGNSGTHDHDISLVRGTDGPDSYFRPGGTGDNNYTTDTSDDGDHTHSIGGANSNVSIVSEGSHDTNAPYLQLFVCQKD